MDKMQINLALPLGQVQKVLSALAAQPLGGVIEVFSSIKAQAEQQIEEAKAGPPKAGD